MNQDELLHLLNAHEWREVEFKEARTAAPRNAFETVSAFANTAGGHLVFGVKKEGTDFEVVGVLDVDKVQNEFLSGLRDSTRISLIMDVQEHLHKCDEEDLLVFYIPEAARTDKPVFLNGDIRRCFIRSGGADVRCSRDELQRLMNDASTDRYDGHTLEFDLESCFDATAISWYRNVYERKPGNRSYADRNDTEFLFELGLIRETPDGRKPTRAAVLLFGRDGTFRDILPRPVADCQRFGAPLDDLAPGVRWTDRMVLDYNLIRSWQSLVDWYQKVATAPFQVDPMTMQRTDIPPDYVAFRESVVNVLIHQDYADHTRKPEIRHFTDQTVFWNPGDAFDTFADLLEPGEKEVRNPRIVTAFRRIGLSENAGWGLRDVFTTWQDLGNVPPVISNDKARKTFELVLPKELLLSEEQLTFQAQLGVHLDADAARLFAYICRKAEISVADAKAVLGQPVDQVLTKLQHLVNQALAREIEPESLYGLAEHLQDRFATDQAGDQAEEKLVTAETDQPPGKDAGTAQPVKRLELTDHQRDAIRLCEVPRSAGDLMAEIGLSHRTFFRNTVLEPLLEARILKQTHPDQPNHPKQAYLLTEAGLRLLEVVKAQPPEQDSES